MNPTILMMMIADCYQMRLRKVCDCVLAIQLSPGGWVLRSLLVVSMQE